MNLPTTDRVDCDWDEEFRCRFCGYSNPIKNYRLRRNCTSPTAQSVDRLECVYRSAATVGTVANCACGAGEFVHVHLCSHPQAQATFQTEYCAPHSKRWAGKADIKFEDGTRKSRIVQPCRGCPLRTTAAQLERG